MNYLAIDYGLSKIGLAISHGSLSQPYQVIPEKSCLKFIPRILEQEKIDKIIIGISEGKSKEITEKFAGKLSKITTIPVIFIDETLSTYDAKKKMIEAGKSQKFRREKEDAVAAALILQSYLDSL